MTFGFQASFNGEKPDIPEKYRLVGDHLIVNKKDCVPKFEVVNSWKDGCIMNVSLFNASEKILKIGHWNVSLIIKLPIFGGQRLVIKKATVIL